jgi:DNA-binding transcriptional MerR regulator
MHILHHACEAEIFGLWMIDELAWPAYKLTPGTIYPLLHSLEQRGLLVSKEKLAGGRQPLSPRTDFVLTLEPVPAFRLFYGRRLMRSGQLAQLTGVSTDTLRHYERLGLLPLPQRTTGNYRVYPPTSRQRVELIQRALAIGFSLSEMKTILAVRDRGGAPCRRVRELLKSKISQVDRQLKNLTSLRSELNRLSKDWDTRLRRTKPGQAARLLESVRPRLDPPAIRSLFANKKKKGQ